MRRGTLLCFIIFQNLFTSVYAQLLDSAALEKQKFYTSYEDAMNEPLKVYRLSIQNPGYVPYNIDTLKNLQSLTLYGNDWDHGLYMLPASIGNLENLQELNIYNTDLQTLPAEIRCLQNLKTIDCNPLVSLPDEIGALKNLENLKLYDIENIPPSFSNLTKLKKFSISKTKNIPANNYLEQLSTSPRTLVKALNPALFTNVKELIVLPNSDYYEVDFDMDSVSKAVEQMGKFPQLTKLDLTKLSLNDQVWSSVVKIKNLESLRLDYYNRVPVKINSLQKLKKLRFSADSANCVAVCKLPQLEEIEIPHLEKEIAKLTRLKKITIIQSEEYPGRLGRRVSTNIATMAKLPQLEEVNGFNMYLSDLPKVLTELKSLKRLDLSATQDLFADSTMHAIEIAFEEISRHPQLEEVTISWIGALDQFSKLQTLKKLIIKYYEFEKPFTENDKLKLSLLLPKCTIQYKTY